jgi:hypothetical protein
MISSIFAGLFQDWLLAKPKQFSIWLYAAEAVAAIAVAALLLFRIPGGGVWPGLGLLWYASYSAMLYFHWDRRCTLKKDEAWTSSGLAKTVAVSCFLGLTALGGGLAYWSYGMSIRVSVIGLVLLAIGLLQLVAIFRRGWPRLGR